MHANLIQHIQRFVSLTEGQICMANYFVAKGCYRLYFMNEKGTENIVQFAIEDWWIADYMSLEKQTPSPFYLQSIEEGIIMALEKQVQEELLQKVPKLERYFRIL